MMCVVFITRVKHWSGFPGEADKRSEAHFHNLGSITTSNNLTHYRTFWSPQPEDSKPSPLSQIHQNLYPSIQMYLPPRSHCDVCGTRNQRGRFFIPNTDLTIWRCENCKMIPHIGSSSCRMLCFWPVCMRRDNINIFSSNGRSSNPRGSGNRSANPRPSNRRPADPRQPNTRPSTSRPINHRPRDLSPPPPRRAPRSPPPPRRAPRAPPVLEDCFTAMGIRDDYEDDLPPPPRRRDNASRDLGGMDSAPPSRAPRRERESVGRRETGLDSVWGSAESDES